MLSVLILSHDDAFRYECAEALKSDGFDSHSVASEDGVSKYLADSGKIDLVIVNAERPNDEIHRVLDYVSQIKPHISVLLTCDSFNYWDDFFIWLADKCLVTPTDVRGLNQAVAELLQCKSGSGPRTESSGFAVEWS